MKFLSFIHLPLLEQIAWDIAAINPFSYSNS